MPDRLGHLTRWARKGAPQGDAKPAPPPKRPGLGLLLSGDQFVRQTVLGIRLSAIVETFIFLGIAAVLDHLYFAGTRFWSLEPHPFWLLVALVSVQYGTNEGVFAAAASSIVLLSGHLPAQSIDTDFYAHVLQLGARPLLWLVSAILIGELRNRHARRELDLEQQVAESHTREHGIALAYQELKAAHEKLEISVASELRTVVGIYRAARTLQNLSVGEVMAGAVNLVSVVLGPEKFSLYTVEGGALNLGLKRGWAEEDSYETAFWPDHPLFQTVVVGQRYVSAADAVDERVLGRQGVLAGPLFQGEGGEVVGMLKIERLRFADLNLTTIENFKVVCDLLSTALGNARRYDAAAAQSIVSTDSMLLSDAFYARQAAFLAALGKRIGFPVSIMRMSIDNPNELTNEQREALPGLVRDATVQVLRSTDLAFEFKSGQWQYVVVLPNTPMANTQVVTDKFRAAILGKLASNVARLNIQCEPLVDGREGGMPGQGLPAVEEYARQSQFLLALARRARFPLSAVRLTVSVNVQLPPTLRMKLPAALLAAVRENLGASDLAFNLERSGLVIAVMMPGSDVVQARTKADELRRAITRKLGGAGGPVAVQVHVEELAGVTGAPSSRPMDPATDGTAYADSPEGAAGPVLPGVPAPVRR
ncbi:MAG: GAF domain-containing protein [Rhodospirillaceae bacterium]|nr:GAF domain-containing protein [Rhodospirillaceae bacterium]